MPTDWNAVSYVISSGYRLATVRQLADSSSTPTAIARAESVSTTHVSSALRELRRRSIVELTVPNTQRKHRTHRLSQRGESVWGAIRAHDLGRLES